MLSIKIANEMSAHVVHAQLISSVCYIKEVLAENGYLRGAVYCYVLFSSLIGALHLYTQYLCPNGTSTLILLLDNWE